jgi:hypothetical protein
MAFKRLAASHEELCYMEIVIIQKESSEVPNVILEHHLIIFFYYIKLLS